MLFQILQNKVSIQPPKLEVAPPPEQNSADLSIPSESSSQNFARNWENINYFAMQIAPLKPIGSFSNAIYGSLDALQVTGDLKFL